MNLKKILAVTLAASAFSLPCLAAEQAAKPAQPAPAQTQSQPEKPAQPPAQKPAPAPQVKAPADVVSWVTAQTATEPCIVGTLAPNQVALGRVHIHYSPNQVTALWNTATSVSGHGKWLTYTYGDTFGVRFHQGGYSRQDYGVSEVSTIANNGIATPAGIEVGMNESILTKKYGMPSRLASASRDNGYTTTYFYYGYGTELGHELSFDVRENKIIKIRLRSYYEFPAHFYR